MQSHILVNGCHTFNAIMMCSPQQYGLKKSLFFSFTHHILTTNFISRTLFFTEMPACICHKRSYIHGITQFLVKQPLTRNIDNPKPFEFFFVGTITEIYG